MKTYYVSIETNPFRHEVQADSPEAAVLIIAAKQCSKYNETALWVHDEGQVYPFSVELKWVAESLLPTEAGGIS